MKSGPLPPSFTRYIAPADRARLGPRAQTNQEAGQKARRRTEKEDQRIFAAWLKLQVDKCLLRYLWHRTDKASTATVGTPDFIVALPSGRTSWIELKAPGNSESTEQQAFRESLLKLGHSATVCHTGAEAIALIAEELPANQIDWG